MTIEIPTEPVNGSILKQLSPETLAEARHLVMADLWNVGPEKPLGYHPIPFVTDYCGKSAAAFAVELEMRGLKAVFGTAMPKDKIQQVIQEQGVLHALHSLRNRTYIEGGALFAYDPEALSKLIDERKDVLEAAGWPVNVDAFVLAVMLAPVAEKTALYDLIADAFGDYDNSHRLYPSPHAQKQPLTGDMLIAEAALGVPVDFYSMSEEMRQAVCSRLTVADIIYCEAVSDYHQFQMHPDLKERGIAWVFNVEGKVRHPDLLEHALDYHEHSSASIRRLYEKANQQILAGQPVDVTGVLHQPKRGVQGQGGGVGY